MKITKSSLPGLTPAEVINGLITTGEVVDKVLPVVTAIFKKIAEAFANIKTDKLSTAPGKRKAIEELIEQVSLLQAQNKAQKLWNAALVQTLKDKGINVEDSE